MMENKRSPCSVDQGNLTTLASKRHKADLSISTKVLENHNPLYLKFVSKQNPRRGKRSSVNESWLYNSLFHHMARQVWRWIFQTDTASVLWEAMEYIQFLHDQVKVLSAPYLQTTPTAKVQEFDDYSLRNRGLCLVPISCTAGVARSNGADIWAPIKTTSPKFEKVITQFH
ncbi:hypothetical protein Pint_26130 [Pistacia integerrima]|uniref:Uncharacterized protein n=1 Tax=Pistacia integerrima TaxID=434235 RepID=A0ACC0YEV8_9ROSI|nr:hypothetical protein Pint_26130 [Pistacia integerrima]